MGGLFIDLFIEYLIRVTLRGMNLLRSHRWPITKGTVLGAKSSGFPAVGCPVATVDYEYAVDGVKYADSYNKPFISSGSAAAYADLFIKGADIKVRLKPGDPSVSVLEPVGWARM